MSTPTAATQFDTATNRLQQESNGQPLPPNAYDAQGNLTNHPWIGQMSYDAEGKIWRHIKGGTTVEFTYDGEGRRVKKRVGTAPPTIYVYDAPGQLAADYGTADGTLNCSTCYITADHLGSTRLTTGATGDTVGRLDYFPFGETIPGGASFGNRPSPTGPRQKFTGKERDGETDLDYFGARYFSGPQGRFTSPDAPFADQFVEDPRSWNLYSYVRNNPLRYIDDDGRGAKEFIFGLVNAVSSNAGATQRSRSSHPHVRMGQRLGDGLSMAGGLVEMAGGATMTGTGAGACGTGVLCAAGAPAIAAGVSIAGHGAMMTGNALANLMQASDDAPGSSGTGAPYEPTQQNVDRMKQGKPPVDKDGKPVELHHQNQNPKGPIQEMSQQQHRGPGNYKQNHPQGSRQPSRIDRNEAARQRREHWKRRAEEIERERNQ